MNFLTEKQKKRFEDAAFRFSYMAKNWKQIVHLVFGTKYFGVNNRLFSKDHSLFERRGIWKIRGIFERIAMMKARAFMGFIPLEDAVRLFPDYAAKNGYGRKEEKE